MTKPAIKGAAIRVLLQDVRDALRDGRISPLAAEWTLLPEDIQLLGEEIVDTGWYDIESYRRFSELLDANLGAGDRSYSKKRGAAVAERLIGLGVYQQMKFLQRAGVSETFATAYQNLKLTATLWNSFFNFGTWTTSEDPAAHIITMLVTDSTPMPARGWDAIEGFILRLVQEVNADDVTVTHERRGDGTERFEFRLGHLAGKA